MDGGVHALVVNVHFVAALAIAALLSTVSTGNDDRLDTATRESEKGFQEARAQPRHFKERQLRASKRNKWARKLDGEGLLPREEGRGIMLPARMGKVIREVTVVDPVKINVFAEIAGMYIVPATKWNAAARATGEVFEDNTQESVERRRETLELAGKNFPSEDFAKSTVSLLVPLEVEFLTLSTHRDFVFEEFMEHLGCIEEK
ncbi:hypothetical protein PF011_g22417 [Phytophthora fragariae]|uniref:Uncharacterized protein n=1 Tax=Phytophthora fragariae TaxID=53985 RepID=A0A6A3IK74_9STRA|nr:hypothetical protein PF011_g22417 [Phytophthora fragariae]